MRHRAMLYFAVAGMFILASAAVSQANWYHQSEGSQGSSSEMTSPSGEQGNDASQAETYEQQQPVEAGQLPPPESLRSGNDFPGGEPVETIDVGGLKYREGIDTGP